MSCISASTFDRYFEWLLNKAKKGQLIGQYPSVNIDKKPIKRENPRPSYEGSKEQSARTNSFKYLNKGHVAQLVRARHS